MECMGVDDLITLTNIRSNECQNLSKQVIRRFYSKILGFFSTQGFIILDIFLEWLFSLQGIPP